MNTVSIKQVIINVIIIEELERIIHELSENKDETESS